MTTALAIPHLPTLPERAENMVRLRRSLGVPEHDNPEFATPVQYGYGCYVREFHEKAPWPERSLRRWKWALRSNQDWFCQLEDDVIISDDFWPALSAMQEAWPTDVICLAATHSQGPLVALQGRRSYFTPRLIGWGCAWPMSWTERLVVESERGDFLKTWAARPGQPCEDTYLAEFFLSRGATPRHPCPTIADHLFFPSTQDGFDLHTNTQASVTWRDYKPGDLCSADWWRTQATHLPPEWTQTVGAMRGLCNWCYAREGRFKSPNTGAELCEICAAHVVLQAMGIAKGRPE